MKKSNRKLISIISFLMVMGFLATSLTSYFVSLRSLRSEIATNELPITSDNIYSEIQRDLLRPVFISSLMASDTFLRDWVIQGETNNENITKYLKEIKTKYGTYTSFFVSDRTMNYYYADGILKKVSPTEERDTWYFRVKQMKDDYEINVDPDMANKDAMTIFVNYRVFDYGGNYIGATGVGLTVDAVKKLIEKYQEKYGREIYFIDKDGNVKLSGAKFKQPMKNFFENRKFSAFKDRIESKVETSFSHKDENGEIIHINVRYINEFEWYLVVEQPEGKTTRNIFNTLIVNLAICAVITAVILILVGLSISAYQKRLDTLRGIVPICCYCKQIRDDKGYWNQVEAYVSKYTDAEFSHGICPTCMKKHHPEFADKE